MNLRRGEEWPCKTGLEFLSSLLVVLWVLLVMASYFRGYIPSLCLLVEVPALCTL